MEKNHGQMQPVTSSKKLTKAVPWTGQDITKLATVLAQTCQMQKTFGKEPGDIKTMVQGFAHFLGDQKIEDVISALEAYVRRNSDIPAPSDLLNIINPPRDEWRPDWEFYKILKQMERDGGAYAISTDEAQYCKACETFSLDRFKRSKE